MIRESGIILDLFPPVSWEESDIVRALDIQETVDTESDMAWGFTPEEMAFLAKCIRYYMQEIPAESWGDNFFIDTDIDPDDPEEDGRYVIDMVYPLHLEAPSSLR